MITPGSLRTASRMTTQFAGLDARANAIPDEDIAAASIRREEVSAANGERPFSNSIEQGWQGDVTIALNSSDGDKATNSTVLHSLAIPSVTPGGADGARGCYGLLVTWTTYLKTCDSYRGVGAFAVEAAGDPLTKGPSDSACVVEVRLSVNGGGGGVTVPGTTRRLRAGARQFLGTGLPFFPDYRIEEAAYITCEGACLLTADRLAALGVPTITSLILSATYEMSDDDYTDLVGLGVLIPEAVFTDTVITAHIIRNAELS